MLIFAHLDPKIGSNMGPKIGLFSKKSTKMVKNWDQRVEIHLNRRKKCKFVVFAKYDNSLLILGYFVRFMV